MNDHEEVFDRIARASSTVSVMGDLMAGLDANLHFIRARTPQTTVAETRLVDLGTRLRALADMADTMAVRTAERRRDKQEATARIDMLIGAA